MKEQADPSSDKADQTGNVQTGCQNGHRNKPWCPRTGARLTPAAVTRPCGGCSSCPGHCPPCPGCPSALPKLSGSSAPASLWLSSAALAQLSLCPDVPALCAPPPALSPFPRATSRSPASLRPAEPPAPSSRARPGHTHPELSPATRGERAPRSAHAVPRRPRHKTTRFASEEDAGQ